MGVEDFDYIYMIYNTIWIVVELVTKTIFVYVFLSPEK